MQRISVEFLTDACTTRVAWLSKFLKGISSGFIAFGVYEVIQQSNRHDEAFSMILENGIPTLLMMIADMHFLELVATDMVLSLCSQLNIFNGFMDRDEDLFMLVRIMGFEYLTGRGGRGRIRQ